MTAPRTDPASGAWPEIVSSGVDAVSQHPVRNTVTALCLVAMITPFVATTAVAEGLLEAAGDALHAGAEIHVHAERFGLPVPVPSAVQEQIAALPGVTAATPRIVSPIVLGARGEPALLVGVPADAARFDDAALRGERFAPGASHEFVLGPTLADALALDVGAAIPPFYRSARGERVARVVGVLSERASPWTARLAFTSIETAAWITNEEHAVTQFLVECDPAATDDVARRIQRMPLGDLATAHENLRLEATTQDDLEFLVPRVLYHRQTAVHLIFALVFAVGVPLVLVTSGLGNAARRREDGLLRAVGWRLDEVLVRSVVEHVTVAIAASGAAVLLAWTWLRFLGGVGIGPLFLHGDAALATSSLPYRLSPMPIILGVGVALTIVLLGSVSATWRAASVPPAQAMS